MFEFTTVIAITAFFVVPVLIYHVIHDLVTLKWNKWLTKTPNSITDRFIKSLISWSITVILELSLVKGFLTVLGPV